MTNSLSHCGDFRTSGRFEEGVMRRTWLGYFKKRTLWPRGPNVRFRGRSGPGVGLG